MQSTAHICRNAQRQNSMQTNRTAHTTQNASPNTCTNPTTTPRSTVVHGLFFCERTPFLLYPVGPYRFPNCTRMPRTGKNRMPRPSRCNHQQIREQRFEDHILPWRQRVFTPREPHTTHICAAGKHVPEIERSICTTKERTRCTVHSMPYKHLPNMMMKHIILDGMSWLNALESKNGISTTMSPSSIVLGTPSPDCKHLKLRTGAYVQLYIGTTNTSKARTVGVIALRRSNESGGYYFMSLKTGCEIHG
jgi:hypothetical protein